MGIRHGAEMTTFEMGLSALCCKDTIALRALLHKVYIAALYLKSYKF